MGDPPDDRITVFSDYGNAGTACAVECGEYVVDGVARPHGRRRLHELCYRGRRFSAIERLGDRADRQTAHVSPFGVNAWHAVQSRIVEIVCG